LRIPLGREIRNDQLVTNAITIQSQIGRSKNRCKVAGITNSINLRGDGNSANHRRCRRNKTKTTQCGGDAPCEGAFCECAFFHEDSG
jgi:hypothetical protein